MIGPAGQLTCSSHRRDPPQCTLSDGMTSAGGGDRETAHRPEPGHMFQSLSCLCWYGPSPPLRLSNPGFAVCKIACDRPLLVQTNQSRCPASQCYYSLPNTHHLNMGWVVEGAFAAIDI